MIPNAPNRIAHVTSSFLFGGPERQMLGMAAALGPSIETHFLSFSEEGRCEPFLQQARQEGFATHQLRYDFPRLWAARNELIRYIREHHIATILCHGYKANVVGMLAAHATSVRRIVVSRGWTHQNLKVRIYEWLDRRLLRWADRVVCVSDSQAEKVRRCGVPVENVVTIHNSVDLSRFANPQSTARAVLEQAFEEVPQFIVGAIGRLSPEKGFDILIDAATKVKATGPSIGFILFGDGVLRGALQQHIHRNGLTGMFVLAGFRQDIDSLIPNLDLLVQSSHTEGLPNVVLEALAAEVPVVATAVGGTVELVVQNETGRLVAAGNAEQLAREILSLLNDPASRQRFKIQGKQLVDRHYSFAAQADAYRSLLFHQQSAERIGSTPEQPVHEVAKSATGSNNRESINSWV